MSRLAWVSARAGLHLDGRGGATSKADALMARRSNAKAPGSPATACRPGLTRNSQTLCTACQRRVQWNGDRWIHLTIYARGMYDARPDLDLVVESDDPWQAEKLVLMEAEA
jgi:hypothetical protein